MAVASVAVGAAVPTAELAPLQDAAEALVRRAAAVVITASERPGLGLTHPQRLEVWDLAMELQALSHELRLSADTSTPDAEQRRELADRLMSLLADLVQAATVLDAAGAGVRA